MDRDTIHIYDEGARDFARDWEDDQPAPDDLYASLGQYFREGPTVDVGCGSGRDTAWLAANGFDALGVDASGSVLDTRVTRSIIRVASRLDYDAADRTVVAGAGPHARPSRPWPSAMLAGTDEAERRIWETIPNISALGNRCVTL